MLVLSTAVFGNADNVYAEGDHSHDGWTELKQNDFPPEESGSYYLGEDISLSQTWNIPEGKTIDLYPK